MGLEFLSVHTTGMEVVGLIEHARTGINNWQQKEEPGLLPYAVHVRCSRLAVNEPIFAPTASLHITVAL